MQIWREGQNGNIDFLRLIALGIQINVQFFCKNHDKWLLFLSLMGDYYTTAPLEKKAFLVLSNLIFGVLKTVLLFLVPFPSDGDSKQSSKFGTSSFRHLNTVVQIFLWKNLLTEGMSLLVSLQTRDASASNMIFGMVDDKSL